MHGKVTNLEIQKWVVRQHSFVPETSWIEACRREWGLTGESAGGESSCPPDKKLIIRQAFRALGLLSSK
ncbi:MAG TPA: hypothetical protein VES20_19740 [Bryobacteraceae bacterium]|nr:hypothetical protein [Bryobacteraceae bacterium]